MRRARADGPSVKIANDATTPTRTRSASAADLLATENVRLREDLQAAEERARVAEEQLLRVHRAVRAAQQNLKSARQRRNAILAMAQQHAAALIRQAQREAELLKRAARANSAPAPTPHAPDPQGQSTVAPPARPVTESRGHQWVDADPSLDDRLDEYLRTELEPDRSREWILGDRAG